MNPSTEISPSTQLLLDEIRKLSDKFDSRWAKQDAVREAFRGVLVPTQSAAVGAAVVADNWGGFFDGGDDSIEQHCAAPPIVADNWGGLFEQPAHTPEERDLLWSDPFPMGGEWADSDDRGVSEVLVPLPELLSSIPDGLVSGEVTHGSELESDLACPEQLTVDVAAIESTSTDPDTRICVTPTPTVSAAVSTSVKANAAVETSPTQYQRQIQGLEKPSSSSFLAAAAKEVVLHTIPFCGYVGSFGPEFEQVVEKKQAAQQEAERPEFLVARAKQERHVAIVRADGLGASSHVFVGVNIQRFHNNFAPDDPGLLRCVRLGLVECALRAILLGGYDGSLDDDPESGFAHFDALIDRGVGHGRLALAAAAAHRADAVGAAGGGPLAWVVSAGPVQTNCSMVCPADDDYFVDVPIDALWEEEMLRWGANNHGLAPESYVDELEVVAPAELTRAQPWLPGLATLCAVRAHHEEKGYESDESDILKGFSILKRDGGTANSGNRCTSPLESFHSDAESNAGLDLNAARRALTMCIIATCRSLSLVDGIGFQSFVHALNLLVPVSRSTLDRDLMTLYAREKDALHTTIPETSGGLSFVVDKWRSNEPCDIYNDDIYPCAIVCFVDAGWKLQRRIMGFKFMKFPDDVTSSKGMHVVEIAETGYLSATHHAELIECQFGGSRLLLSASMVGCVLIHELVQRKCDDKCRCFLLEVSGQQSRIAEG